MGRRCKRADGPLFATRHGARSSGTTAPSGRTARAQKKRRHAEVSGARWELDEIEGDCACKATGTYAPRTHSSWWAAAADGARDAAEKVPAIFPPAAASAAAAGAGCRGGALGGAPRPAATEK